MEMGVLASKEGEISIYDFEKQQSGISPNHFNFLIFLDAGVGFPTN